LTSGVNIVAHSSGAPILSGAGGYLAGTMTGAVVATTMVTAGIIVGGTTLTVELACAPKNHPDLVKRVVDSAMEYKTISKGKLQELVDVSNKYYIETKDRIYEMMGETWHERFFRKTKEAFGFQ
jgi:hypothetical protein